jgi:AAA family ATP:ADP antiporter
VLPLGCRSLANDVCTVDEAKSVYPFMAIGANIALVIAGTYIRWVNAVLPAGSQLLGLRVLVGTVLAMSVAMFGAKAYIDAKVLGSKEPAEAPKKKKKSKGSFSESLAVLRNSPKIRNLALLVMSYGIGHR